MEGFDWERVGFRVIPGWGAYVMGPGLDVWSLPRVVPCKGGRTRQKAATKLKPSNDGRVSLSQDGKKQRFHVRRELYPVVFPELVKERQIWCRKGHLILEPVNPEMFGSLSSCVKPRVAFWGSGNRICLWCHTPPDRFDTDNRYSLEYGVSVAAYAARPRPPREDKIGLRDDDPYQLAELEWMEQGFIISNSPW